ncbi:hypothetical protein GOBAR_DD02945 [Gossypium barbadense]|nr:hypothetical protein GOBAR_DD02945 [Gossypium barbadense]
MANLWHPIGSVSISDLGEKRFRFQFYAVVNIDRVLQGSPWTFNNHLLVFHRLMSGENLLKVFLGFLDFWVQIHDILVGYRTKSLARQFGAFLGTRLFNPWFWSTTVSTYSGSVGCPNFIKAEKAPCFNLSTLGICTVLL